MLLPHSGKWFFCPRKGQSQVERSLFLFFLYSNIVMPKFLADNTFHWHNKVVLDANLCVPQIFFFSLPEFFLPGFPPANILHIACFAHASQPLLPRQLKLWGTQLSMFNLQCKYCCILGNQACSSARFPPAGFTCFKKREPSSVNQHLTSHPC